MEMVGKMMPLQNELTNNMINMKKQNNMRITLQGFLAKNSFASYIVKVASRLLLISLPQKGIDGNEIWSTR